MVVESLNGNSWGNPAPLDWSKDGEEQGAGVSLGRDPLQLSQGEGWPRRDTCCGLGGLSPLLLHALLFGDHVPCRIS